MGRLVSYGDGSRGSPELVETRLIGGYRCKRAVKRLKTTEADWPAAKRVESLRSSHEEKTRAAARELPAKKRSKTSRGHRGMNVTRSVVRHESQCDSSVVVVDVDVQCFESATIMRPDIDMDTAESPLTSLEHKRDLLITEGTMRSLP